MLARMPAWMNKYSNWPDQRGETQGYERPGPTKRGDAIGQAIAKGFAEKQTSTSC
jgi:hypothetical protein